MWAEHISKECLRRFYKNWYRCKAKAFTKYAAKAQDPKGKKARERDFERIKKFCQVVRVICHPQIKKLGLRQKKAQVFEIQLNGGNPAQKVDWAKANFEKEIRVGDVFQPNENIDVIGVTKGKGYTGVIKRFGCPRLPRKSHRGFRKVACIGAWHPSRVMHTVPRAGQMGYHHRTDRNKKIYKIGKGTNYGEKNNAKTDSDPADKCITPLGGFPHYGEVREDYLLMRGSVMGVKKKALTLRKAIFPPAGNLVKEVADIKFIDTASKIGHGRFQTKEEKAKFYGTTKEAAKAEEKKAAATAAPAEAKPVEPAKKA